MASLTRGEGLERGPKRSLKDELASLRIERAPTRPARGGGRREGGARLLSALLWLIPLGLLGGGAAFAYLQYQNLRPRVEVTVAPVQAMTAGEAEQLLSAKGYLKARHQALINAKLNGRVEKLLIEEGVRVRKGQLLAVLEHDDLRAALESRHAMIRKAEADLAEAQADLRDKERKALRQRRLVAQGFASSEDVDLTITARDMTAARIASIAATIVQARAAAHEVEESIRNMHIYAPFDGVVVSKDAEVGETVSNFNLGGSQSRSAVATLADLDHMEVETDVAENVLARIAVGQPAEISVSAVPERRFRGRLRQIIPIGDRTRGTIKVKVEILDGDRRLFPELVATVHFLPDVAHPTERSDRPSLFVPKSALVEEGGHSYVFAVDSGGVVRKKVVEVVVTKDDLARVEKGLSAGEIVVLQPPRGLREGEKVKVAE